MLPSPGASLQQRRRRRGEKQEMVSTVTTTSESWKRFKQESRFRKGKRGGGEIESEGPGRRRFFFPRCSLLSLFALFSLSRPSQKRHPRPAARLLSRLSLELRAARALQRGRRALHCSHHASAWRPQCRPLGRGPGGGARCCCRFDVVACERKQCVGLWGFSCALCWLWHRPRIWRVRETASSD